MRVNQVAHQEQVHNNQGAIITNIPTSILIHRSFMKLEPWSKLEEHEGGVSWSLPFLAIQIQKSQGSSSKLQETPNIQRRTS